MKDKILLLCKRLNKFTLDEIATISEIDSEDLKTVLNELIDENKITNSADYYCYNKQKINFGNTKSIATFFQYHDKNTIDLIIRCFCAEIPVIKTSLIIEPSRNSVSNFYAFFRKRLYEKQYQKLEILFNKNPKIPSIRSLYDKKIYLYNYNNEIFVAEKPLKTSKTLVHHTKSELQYVFKMYYRVRRQFLNHSFSNVVAFVAYEKIWQQVYAQKDKENILREFFNIS